MSVVIPSLRGAIAVPSWAKNELWRKAAAEPSLDLRFADNKSLVDATTGQNLVTFTRASSGTFVGSNGVLQTVATNVPRFDHNPTTGESLGLLVEEARTNGIRNNTMVGAVAGTPGTNPNLWQYVTAQSNGLTVSVVGTGTESGINYIDYRFNGTTVASPNTIAFGIDSTTAATGQAWTNSLYWKLAGGTATGVTGWQIGVIELTAVGGFVTGANYSQTAPTSAALITQRPAATRTLSGGVTVGRAQMTSNIVVSGNTAIDFTLRIGLPQLEQGAFATSPILTSTAAATRSADLASITGSAFSSWYRQDEGTLLSSAASNTLSSGSNYWDFTDGTTNNRMVPYTTTPTNSQIFYATGGVGFGLAPGAIVFGSRNSLAFGYQVNNFAAVLNGGSPVVNTSSAVAVGINKVNIGTNLFGTASLNGTIRRITYWPQRLANSTLQSITS